MPIYVPPNDTTKSLTRLTYRTISAAEYTHRAVGQSLNPVLLVGQSFQKDDDFRLRHIFLFHTCTSSSHPYMRKPKGLANDCQHMEKKGRES
jgi:hypothetical protein